MDNLLKNLKFRMATPDDVDFVIDCIIEAEKSGTQTINTCNIFDLTEKEYRDALRNILLEDLPEYDFWLSGYLIAELDGRPVCAQGAWFEGKDETPSGTIKTTMMMDHIPKNKFNLDISTVRFVKGLSIRRENKTIQLEHAYTVPDLRRKGIHMQTNLEIMKRNFDRISEASKVQAILFKGNCKSYNELIKLGFTKVIEKNVDNPDILKIFAYDTRIMMELTRDQFNEAYNKFRI